MADTKELVQSALTQAGTWIQVFALIVAVGTIGSVVFGLRHWILGERLSVLQRDEDRKQEAELEKLRAQTAQAELRARQLEEQIQPRYLSTEQVDQITQKLRIFAGGSLAITSHWMDAEAERLAIQLKSLINNAGIGTGKKDIYSGTVDKIGQYPEIPGAMFGGGGFSARNVHVGVELWGKQEAIVLLKGELRSTENIKSVEILDKPPSGLESFSFVTIGIFVGVKPIPDQQRVKSTSIQ